MKGFVEVVDNRERRHLINVRHIEEVVERGEDDCYIYLAHNSPNAVESDYYLVHEPYEVIKMLIERKEGAGMGDYYCSLCQEIVSGNEFNYCPYCGAKMDGGKKE